MLFVRGIIGCGLIGLYCTYQQESVETRVKKWSFFSSNRQSRGWRLRPFPGMLLCPLNIPKITIFHGIGCSLHLNIEHLFVLLCFLGVWAKAWIHFSRYSCWCKQNRWSLNHKDMALRRKGGETHGRPPAPLDIKFEISCSNGGCVGRVSI